MSQLDDDIEDNELDQFIASVLGNFLDDVGSNADAADEVINDYPGLEVYDDESEYPEGF